MGRSCGIAVTAPKQCDCTTYQSRLHHVDNLQAAHEYCNRPKGNTPDVSKWRHPKLWPLPVALKQTPDRGYLWVPAGH